MIGIMQSLPLLILESQAARNRLRKTFELGNDCRSRFEQNGVARSCEERPVSLPGPWKRSSRINTKRVCTATAVIGIAAIGTLFYQATKETKISRGQTITRLAAAVQENDKPVVFDAILKDQKMMDVCP